jgi:hypothetical protein
VRDARCVGACVLQLTRRTFCHAPDIFGVIMARVNVVNLNLVRGFGVQHCASRLR